MTKYDASNGIHANKLLGIWQDTEGYIWVADEVGFTRINGREILNFHSNGSLFSQYTNFIYLKNNIFYFEGGTFNRNNYSISSDFDNSKNTLIKSLSLILFEGDTLTSNHLTQTIPLQYKLISTDNVLTYVVTSLGDTVDVSKLKGYNYKPYTINYDSVLEKNKNSVIQEELKKQSPFQLNIPHHILNDNKFFLLSDSGIYRIDHQSRIKSWPMPDLEGIYKIAEDTNQNLYIISIERNEVVSYSKNGKELNSFDIFEGSHPFRSIQLIETTEAVYLVTDKSIIKLDSNAVKVAQFDGSTISRVVRASGDALYFKVTTSDETWMYQYRKSEVHKLFKLPNNINPSFKVFTDRESNIWIATDLGLYKLEPWAEIPNYFGQIEGRLFFSSADGGHKRNDITLALTNGILDISHPNPQSCILKFISGSFVDSVNFSCQLKFLGKSERNQFIFQRTNLDKTKCIVSIKENSPLILNDIDLAASDADYAMIGQIITQGNCIYKLEENSLNLVTSFEKFSEIKLCGNYTNSTDVFVFKAKDTLYSWSSKKFIALRSLNELRELTFIDKKRISIFTNDSLFVYTDDGGLYESRKLPVELIPNFHPTRRGVKLNSNSYLFVGKLKELIYYNSESMIILKVSDVFNLSIPYVNNIYFDSIRKELYLFSGRTVYCLKENKLSANLEIVRLIDVPEDHPEIYDPMVFFVDQKLIFQSFSTYLYAVETNYRPAFDSLQAKIENIEVYNASRSIVVKDSTNIAGAKFMYDQNNVAFYTETITNYFPETVKYFYRLDGPTAGHWQTTYSDSIVFTNLDPGQYTFRFRAENGFEISSREISYSFTIQPPWWQTLWFRTIAGLIILLTLFGLYRWRTSALRTRQKQLEKTVEDRTQELQKEKELVEEKHKEITDSINYAERIQRSFLATKDLLDENLKEYFVLFQPKDVVSGDFYWATKLQNNQFALVTADSTGHGVPGAIMSILNITCLEKAVQEDKLVEPGEILNHARLNIIERLKKDGSADGGKDGMDASLVCFDLQTKKLNYAAANNPVWIVRQNEILEFAPDKMPVGKHDKQHIPFTSNQVELKTGDVVYTLTDGMPDQFGGEKGKKFMYKKLKELLISISNDTMEMQKEKLSKAFFDWKGDLEQVDDVCVIGVRVY